MKVNCREILYRQRIAWFCACMLIKLWQESDYALLSFEYAAVGRKTCIFYSPSISGSYQYLTKKPENYHSTQGSTSRPSIPFSLQVERLFLPLCSPLNMVPSYSITSQGSDFLSFFFLSSFFSFWNVCLPHRLCISLHVKIYIRDQVNSIPVTGRFSFISVAINLTMVLC